MTQNPFGYAPQPAPQGQPWGPAPQPAAQGPNPFAQPGQDANPFVNATPAVGGDGAYPSNRQLVGRLLVFTVTSFTPNVQGQYGVQDQIIADTAILDGPPMTHKLDGRTLQPTAEFPFPLAAPYVVQGMTWSQKLIVQTLRPHVGTGRPIIGRLALGVKRGSNDAPLKLDPATDAEINGLAMEFWRNREGILAAQAAKWEAHQPATPAQPGQYAGLNIPPAGYPAQPQYQPAPAGPAFQGQPGYGPAFQGQPGYGPPAQPWGSPAPQGAPQPHQAAPVQDAPAWTPEPQGAPAGWPTHQG